jgi:hypothetical protein
MKNFVSAILVVSFSLIAQARRSPQSEVARTPEDRLGRSVVVARAEAEQYGKILAKLGVYANYCDMAQTPRTNALSNAYRQKHQVWRDLDRKSYVPFGGGRVGLNAFDSYNTAEFNNASLAFIQRRDGVRPAGGGPATGGIGTEAACSQGLAEFNQLIAMSTQELLAHIRQVIAAPPAVRTAETPNPGPARADQPASTSEATERDDNNPDGDND